MSFLKSDNENPIKTLLREALIDPSVRVKDDDKDITVQDEHPTPHIKQPNGLVEGAVKTIAGMLRVITFCLENSMQHSISGEHPLLHWLVEWAAWQGTTRTVGVKMASLRTSGSAAHVC